MSDKADEHRWVVEAAILLRADGRDDRLVTVRLGARRRLLVNLDSGIATPAGLLVAGIGSIWPLHELGTGLVLLFLTLFNAVLGLNQEGKAPAAVAALQAAQFVEAFVAQRLIRALNPRPGAAFAKVEARYVVPDVIVKKVRNVWRASLNPDAMPRLRINRLYAELAAGARAGGAGISSQLQEARWLIKNVQQRFETILRVSQAIVERQRHFLEHGEVAMRPLVLREIAETLSLHESTISRVTTQKYMATPRGTFELKYFFGSHVATDSGGAASATAIRALIKQLVAAENIKTPLTDSRIAELLGEQGIIVARRTVAKYRNELNILPSNMRKQF